MWDKDAKNIILPKITEMHKLCFHFIWRISILTARRQRLSSDIQWKGSNVNISSSFIAGLQAWDFKLLWCASSIFKSIVADTSFHDGDNMYIKHTGITRHRRYHCHYQSCVCHNLGQGFSSFPYISVIFLISSE